jgi:transposase
MFGSRGLGPRKTMVGMLDQDTWVSIRLLHARQGKSKSWLAREFGLSRNTVAKYLRGPEAPSYRVIQARGRPVFDKWEEHVRTILAEDRNAPRKQKHTANRVYQRLKNEYGYTGSARTVRYVVAEIKNKPSKATFLPLQYELGKDAQVDFGESYADIAGVRTKVYSFEMRLNYSRKKFAMAVQALNMESFMEAHVQAFEFFGGVPCRLTYDNLSLAVIKVGKGKDRTLTKKFKELKGFYAFETNFCTPGKEGAHEKGGIEGSIGFSRRNWMVPVPKVDSIEELNSLLLRYCREDGNRTVAGQQESIEEAFTKEKPILLKLPARRFDAGVARSNVIADSYQTVVYDGNRYSVPGKYVGSPLMVRAYLDKLVFSTNVEVIAEHKRSYEKEKYILKPEHYLDQLERKPHAVPYARPLLQAQWPNGYWDYYRRLVEERGGSEGGWHFIRILKCHMQQGADCTSAAIVESLESGVVSADAVLQIVDRQKFKQYYQPEILDLSMHPNLSKYVVELGCTLQYQILIGERKDEQCAA